MPAKSGGNKNAVKTYTSDFFTVTKVLRDNLKVKSYTL